MGIGQRAVRGVVIVGGPIILASLALPACTGARERGRAADATMVGKIDQQRYEATAFYIKITCSDDSDKVIDGRFVLEPPYSYKVYPGKKYRLTLHMQDGRYYDGNVEVLSEGGRYGRYPGYEICFDNGLLSAMDAQGMISFFIQSPTGQRVLRVSMSKR